MGAGKGLLRSPLSSVGCRGDVPVPDSKTLVLLRMEVWRSVGDKCISHCYRKAAEVGWGCPGEGHSPLHSPFPKLDSSGHWKILPGKESHQKEKLRDVLPGVLLGQGLCLAWGVPALPSAPAAPGVPAQALWNRAQLGCGDCTHLHKILSSCFLLRSPKIESAGSSDSKSLGFSEYESRNSSAAQGGFPSTQQVSPSSPHLALQVGQWQSW